MRIAIFTDTYLPAIDGVVNSLLSTKRQLEALGHEVIIFAPEDGKNEHKEDGTIYCKAKEFKKYPGYRIAFFPSREADLLKEIGADLIHTHGIAFMGLKGMWVSRELEIPMALTFHTMILDAISYYTPVKLKLAFLEKLTRSYLRFFLHRCAGVVAPSRAVLWELKALAPRIKRGEVIPNGVDVNRFHPDIDDYEIREKWGLNGKDVILHVGRVAPEKNLKLLLKAFPIVKRKRPEAKLLIVGRGPALGEYFHLARKMDLIGDVIFTGFVADEELPKYYACCDVFAIPSMFETQGLVVLEAMASGKPVAGVNFRAIPEFVKDGINGYLFEPDDVKGFAQAVLNCLESSDEMGSEARRIAEHYSVEKCTKKLVDFYEELLGG